MGEKVYAVPIVLFVFRRLDTVKLILDKIREVHPQKLYIFSDGSRNGIVEEEQQVQAVRTYVREFIDWDCDTCYQFAETNKGCAENICDGISYVFRTEPYAVILEDDAVPTKAFFHYCEYLLHKYEGDKRIQYIAGFNAVGDKSAIMDSYAFSKTAPMSGAIATWADRWNQCDFKMKNWLDNKRKKRFKRYFYSIEFYREQVKAWNDSYKGLNAGWDYQFHHDLFDKGRYAIVPKGNLAKSYGYVEGAFHPQSIIEAANLKTIMDFTKEKYIFPLKEPKEVKLNVEYERLRQKYMLKVRGNYFQRHKYYIFRKCKDLAYKYLPRKVWELGKRIVAK